MGEHNQKRVAFLEKSPYQMIKKKERVSQPREAEIKRAPTGREKKGKSLHRERDNPQVFREEEAL